MELKSKLDLLQLEHKSKSCSTKYIPIKTSEFVEKLTNFTFKTGKKYRSQSSAHYVEMTKGEDISLFIENSFDRTMSLRLSFNYKGFIFGRIKQIHIGQPATDMIGSIGEINSWYNAASKTIENMKTINLSEHDMLQIATIAFKDRGLNVSQVTNLNMKYFSNSLDYVMYIVDGLRHGSFERVARNGSKPIKEVKNESLMVKINNSIWEYLESNNPELQI